MFLFPSIAVGLALALALGGRPSRLLDVDIRLPWAAPTALAVQLVIFSGHVTLPAAAMATLHLATYSLLVAFAIANRRLVALLPALLGMILNAIAIALNGGVMPVSKAAAQAAGLTIGDGSNVALGARHARFLGDVFALPVHLPLTNVFSVGDLLIGFGMVGFIVAVSVRRDSEPLVGIGRLAAPFHHAYFTRFVCARFVTQAGDWLTLAAVVGWMFQTTHSTTDVAAVLLVRLTPPILGGATAALVVDRLPKRPLLVGVELGRCGAIVAAFLAIESGSKAAMFAALAISGILAALSTAAVPALVPRLLPVEIYSAGNAALGIADNTAAAIGAVGGGVALTLLGIGAALAIDVATFAFAAILLLGVHVPAGAVERAARATSRLFGFRYVHARRHLFVLVLSFGAATLATGLVNATLPRLLADQTSLGAGAYGYGLATITIGLALGGAAVGMLRLGGEARRWIGCGLILMAGLLAVLALDRNVPTIFLMLAAIGFVDGSTDVVFETIVQCEADPHVLGSVFGFAAVFVRTTMVVSIAVAPLVNRFLPPGHVVLAGAGFLAVVGLLGLAALARAHTSTAAHTSAAVGPAPR